MPRLSQSRRAVQSESAAPALGPPGAAASADVAIIAPLAFGVRNVLHSGLLTLLRERDVRTELWLGAAVVQHAPAPSSHLVVRPLVAAPVARRPRGKPALDALLAASFGRRYELTYHHILGRWSHRDDGAMLRLRHVVLEALARGGQFDPWYGWLRQAAAALERRTYDLGPVRDALARHRPALLVSTSSIAWEEPPYFMAARELGVPVLACILSFDNLTSRSLLPEADHYAVWNERMRARLLTVHPRLDPARVHVTGTPQFDFHARAELRWSRADTLDRLGLEPEDRYLVYAANSAVHTPSEPALVARLARACADVPALRTHRIVLRLHPLDDPARWDGIEQADARLRRCPPGGDGDAGGQALLVNLLRHADVCVNMASTMSLDAAAVGTPVVCVGFAVGEAAEHAYCRDVYRADHYRPIVESGGVRVAQDLNGLLEACAAYVRHPALDAEARGRLAAAECGPVDGRSATRLADLIARLSGRGQPGGG